MNKSLIVAIAGLSLLTFPMSALADRDSRSIKRHDQQWHSHRAHQRTEVRNERRSGTAAREKHPRNKTQYRRHKTDYKVVERRIAKHRIAQDYKHKRHHYNDAKKHYKRDRRWVINHRNNRRFVTRRDFYNHYYGYGNIHFYDVHRRHYEKFHGRHSRHLAVRHHNHESDYLEWVAIMYLLNDIYDDDRVSDHSHHGHND